jgi:predicted nucleotidyltransferase component of viral defense system
MIKKQIFPILPILTFSSRSFASLRSSRLILVHWMKLRPVVDKYVMFWYYENMKKYNPIRHIELFHLLFLDHLGRKLDKNLYALKGGCNLRFFLNSIRYSQDIDFDVHQIRVDTLRNNVNKLLESTPFSYILRTNKIEISDFSEPKQTETTQRWKFRLKVPDSSLPLHTKIEFSRREKADDVVFESINPTIIHAYNLPPIYINHYTSEEALKQKIEALICRNQTQARDVFDIHHLLKMAVKLKKLTPEIEIRLQEAETNALSLSFDDFKSQVISYLPYEYQEQYDDPKVWEKMIFEVIEKIKT